MSNDLPILRGFFGTDRLAEFLEGYWPERLFVVHGDKSRLPPALLEAELNDFFALARRYKGVVSLFGSETSPNMVPVEGINPASPYQFGLSVYLTDIAPVYPQVAELLRSLEAELGANEGSARAGVFASPTASGISCHYDTVDVFSIQLRGTKRFEVASVREVSHPSGHQYIPGNRPIDDLYPQAAGGFPRWREEDFTSVEMVPGSVLYMPRGTWHRTEAGEDSISVSIGLSPPSAAECVLEQLRLLMLQDPEWRRPLYGAWGEGGARADARERAGALLDSLARMTGALDADMLAAPSTPERKRIAAIDSQSRLQRTPHTALELDGAGASGDTVVARIMTSENARARITAQVEMPARYVPLLGWLAEKRESFVLADLEARFGELDADDHRELAQVLAQAGFLKVLWFPKL